MTISSTVRKAGPFTGNDSTTDFAFAFKVFAASDILAVKLNVSTGIESDLVITTDYTVALNADQNANPGGTVTLLSALATGYKLTITSDIDVLQQTDLTNQGGFYPKVITNALDKLTIIAQQLKEALDRTLKVAVSTSSGVSTTLPVPEANKLIGWNPTADNLQNMDPTTLATIVAFGTANADIFSGDGATTTFALSANPGALNNLDVAIGGETQRPNLDYSWSSGTTITFTVAPVAGTSNVLVRYLQALPQGVTDAALVTSSDSASGSLWTTVQGFINKIISSVGSSVVGFIQSGTGAVATDVQSKLRESVSVKDFGAIGDGVNDDSAEILLAINYIKSIGGGTVYFPNGVYKISTTLVIDSPYVTLKGDGGAIDGNQPFQDSWANIIAEAGTRIVWGGGATGPMALFSPADVVSPVSSPLQGGGFSGIMWDGAEVATVGVKILSTRAAVYENSSVVRCTVINMDLGVTVNDLYDGGYGTNTSLSLCHFTNITCSNALLAGNTALPVRMYGNGLKGGVNQCVFTNNQWYGADYNANTVDIGNSDDNYFESCRWSGFLTLHASDTGPNPVSTDFPKSLAQNHMFVFPLGRMKVKTTIGAISGTNLPSFGHGVSLHSGNLPGFTIKQQIDVGAGADISIFGTTLDFANRSGMMSYGTQPAITNVYTNALQSISNGSTQIVSWNSSQYDRLEGWSAGSPTNITVPTNIKWAEVTFTGSWANNSVGQRYAGIYLAGYPIAAQQVASSGLSNFSLSTGVVSVVPGQVIDARVLQASGGALDLSNVCRMTVKWY